MRLSYPRHAAAARRRRSPQDDTAKQNSQLRPQTEPAQPRDTAREQETETKPIHTYIKGPHKHYLQE